MSKQRSITLTVYRAEEWCCQDSLTEGWAIGGGSTIREAVEDWASEFRWFWQTMDEMSESGKGIDNPAYQKAKRNLQAFGEESQP